jgi:hypothetical protein
MWTFNRPVHPYPFLILFLYIRLSVNVFIVWRNAQGVRHAVLPTEQLQCSANRKARYAAAKW